MVIYGVELKGLRQVKAWDLLQLRLLLGVVEITIFMNVVMLIM